VSEEDKRERMDVIVRQAERMERLLRRDLDLALMESGDLKCAREPFDLAALVKEAVEDMATAETQHVFRTEIPKSIPSALGDAERNLQILGNLLSNAVKFSPEGSAITLRVSANDVVRVDVHNEGEGIEPTRLQEIFEKMTRLDASREGTGLGLYISRYLVEAQGGDIAASSEPGQGATFSFTLPVADRA
jgi:signal transduction histidine kinase